MDTKGCGNYRPFCGEFASGAPAATQEPQASPVVCITLDRSGGRSLGFRVGKDGRRLLVMRVEESGLVP